MYLKSVDNSLQIIKSKGAPSGNSLRGITSPAKSISISDKGVKN
jgi:hypothetical protein